MIKKPLISVVLPVYNVAQYLQLSVDSVLQQDYDNFEIILVDDGSTDDSSSVCDDFAKRFGNVKVIHKENAGLGWARNTGLDNSQGEYVYFLDSDDTIQPDTLSRLVEILNQEENISLISTDFQLVPEIERMKPAINDNGFVIYRNKSDIQRKFLLREIVILAPGTLYNRRWLIDNHLKFKKVPYSEDQLFIWEVLMKVNKTAHIYRAQYNYLQRPGSIMSGSKIAKVRDAYSYFKELHDEIKSSEDADELVKDYMLSRWCMGIFHSASKLCSFHEYKDLLKHFDAKAHIKTIRKFPDFKMKIMAYSGSLGLRCFYWINRII